MRRRAIILSAAVVITLLAVGIAQALMPDFGSQRDHLLESQVAARFGDSVGIEEKDVASFELHGGLAERLGGIDSQRIADGRLEHVNGAVR